MQIQTDSYPPQVHKKRTTAIDGGSVIERSGLDGREVPGEGGACENFFGGKGKTKWPCASTSPVALRVLTAVDK